MPSNADTTQLLLASRGGDRQAFDLLFTRVYDELRQIAHYRLLRNRPGETLSTTVLVHEAYLKLVDRSLVAAGDRAHFLALASRAMRFILVDHARARRAQKRGGAGARLGLDEVQLVSEGPVPDLVALDEALERLEKTSSRLGRLVEYRFFGGLTYEEIAEAMDLSLRTVKRDWIRARTWLYSYMETASA